MAKTILAEAREIVLMISMLMVLSIMSLAVACGAVVLADHQTLHIAAMAGSAPIDQMQP